MLYVSNGQFAFKEYRICARYIIITKLAISCGSNDIHDGMLKINDNISRFIFLLVNDHANLRRFGIPQPQILYSLNGKWRKKSEASHWDLDPDLSGWVMKCKQIRSKYFQIHYK